MKFSILIPSFKKTFLNCAIQSVCTQTYQDWELIIVDDYSPEDLYQIVEPYLKDHRIRYYRNEKNCGAINVVDNWNICLSYCKGDYVICMGDDDCLLPCCLTEYVALIEKYPDLNVYHARTEIIDENGSIIDSQEERPEWESVLSLIWNRWAYRDKQYIGDFCYRLQHLKNAGGFYKLPLAWGSDDVTAAIAAKDGGIANMQAFGFQYRENARTITSSSDNARIKLQATLAQYEWFGNLLAALSKTKLTDEDVGFLNTIGTPRKVYYYKSMGKNCTDYIKGNPFRLLECYRLLESLHFPIGAFLKWYTSSIYHLFFHS